MIKSLKQNASIQEIKDFFESIPSEKWHKGNYASEDGQCFCAVGLLNLASSKDPNNPFYAKGDYSSKALGHVVSDIIAKYTIHKGWENTYVTRINLANINDASNNAHKIFPQSHPKDRVLALFNMMLEDKFEIS